MPTPDELLAELQQVERPVTTPTPEAAHAQRLQQELDIAGGAPAMSPESDEDAALANRAGARADAAENGMGSYIATAGSQAVGRVVGAVPVVGPVVAGIPQGVGQGVRDVGQVIAGGLDLAGMPYARGVEHELAQDSEESENAAAAQDLDPKRNRIGRKLGRLGTAIALTAPTGMGPVAATAAAIGGGGAFAAEGAKRTAEDEGLTGGAKAAYVIESGLAGALPAAVFHGAARSVGELGGEAVPMIRDSITKAFAVGAGHQIGQMEATELAQTFIDQQLPSNDQRTVGQALADYVRGLPERVVVNAIAGGIPHALGEASKPTLDQAIPALPVDPRAGLDQMAPQARAGEYGPVDAAADAPAAQPPEGRVGYTREVPSRADQVRQTAADRLAEIQALESGEGLGPASNELADQSRGADAQARQDDLRRALAERRAIPELEASNDEQRGETAHADAEAAAEAARAPHPEPLNPELADQVHAVLQEQLRAGTTSLGMRQRLASLANGLGTVETVRHEDPTGRAADAGEEHREVTTAVGPDHHQARIGTSPFVDRFIAKAGGANLDSLRSAIERASHGEPIAGRTLGERHLIDEAAHGLTENPEEAGPPDLFLKDLETVPERGVPAPPERARAGRPVAPEIEPELRGFGGIPEHQRAEPPRPVEPPPTPAKPYAPSPAGHEVAEAEERGEGPAPAQRAAQAPAAAANVPRQGSARSGRSEAPSAERTSAAELKARFLDYGRRIGKGDEYGETAWKLVEHRARSAGVPLDEYVARTFRGKGLELAESGAPSLNQKVDEPAEELDQSAARDGDMPGQQAADFAGAKAAEPKPPGPVWTTKARQLLADPKFPAKASGDQVLAYLRNKGVNDRELYWTGLDKLAGQKGVTPEQVAAMIQEPRLVERLNGGDGQKRLESANREFVAHLSQFMDEATANDYALQIARADTHTDKEEAISGAQKMAEQRSRRELDGPDLMDIHRLGSRLRTAYIGRESSDSPTRYEDYTLPGGANYRELLMTLPGKRNWLDGSPVTDEDLATEHGRAAADRVATSDVKYRSAHWPGVENPLLHVRFNERTDADGKRVLHVEEIQSDWHQAGREEGYQGDPNPAYEKAKAERDAALKAAADKRAEAHAVTDRQVGALDRWEAQHGKAALNLEAWRTSREYEETQRLSAEFDRLSREADRLDRAVPHDPERMVRGQVAPAPFAKTWEEVGFRRMVRWAAEHGFDKLTWTTGEQQAARYDLAKRVSEIRLDPKTRTLDVLDGGNQQVLREEGASDQRIVDLIGKDAANRLMQAPLDEDGVHRLTGDGLKVGGEGMKAAYDQRLVSIAKALAKKLDPEAKVGVTRVLAGNGANGARPRFEVVDENGESRGMFDTRYAARVYIDREAERSFDQGLGENDARPTRADRDNAIADIMDRFEIHEQHDGESRPLVHSLDITPKIRDAALEGQPLLFQRALNKEQGDVVRGKVDFKDPAGAQRALITAMRTANESTLVHELGHVFRRQVTGEDLATLERWANVKNGTWTRAAEERFATAWERYLRDGQAPAGAPELRSVFQRFADWLRKVYTSIRGTGLEASLPRDVRAVMDKLLTPDAMRLPAGQGEIPEGFDAGRAGRGEPAAGAAAEAAPRARVVDVPPARADDRGARPAPRMAAGDAAEPTRGRNADDLTRDDRAPLANYGMTPPVREDVAARDAQRAAPAKRGLDAVAQEAHDRLAQDYNGERKAVFDAAREGRPLTDTETMIAREVLNREGAQAIALGNREKLAEHAVMHDAYRNSGTEAARSLGARRDRYQSKAEAVRSIVTDSLFTPPPTIDRAMRTLRRQIAKRSASGQPIDQQMRELSRLQERAGAQLDKVRDHFRQLGIDLLYQGNDPEQLARIVNAASEANRTWGGVLREHWTAGVLSAPRTILSNAQGWNALWRTTAERFGEAVLNHLLPGERSPDAPTLGEIPRVLGALLSSNTWREAQQNAVRTFMAERYVFGDEIEGDLNEVERDIRPGYGVQTPGGYGKVIRTPLRLHSMAVQFHKTWAAHVEVAALAHRIAKSQGLAGDELESRVRDLIDDRESEAWTQAKERAKDFMFQGELGDLAKRFQKFRDWAIPHTDIRPLAMLVPFVKVPTNILKQGLANSPLGAIRMAGRWYTHLAGGETYSRDQVIHDAARTMLGFVLSGAVMGWASQTDDDGVPNVMGTTEGMTPAQRELLARQGVTAMSMRIPGTETRLGYGKIEPFATPVAMAADFARKLHDARTGKNHTSAFAAVRDSVLGQVKEKDFVAQLADLGKLMQPGGRDDEGSRWLGDYARSWIPNVLAGPAKQLDNTVRDFHDRPLDVNETWWNTNLKRTFLPWTRPPRVSVWGDEISKTDPGAASARWYTALREFPVAGFDLGQPAPRRDLDRLIANWNNAPNGAEAYYPEPASPKYQLRDRVPRMMTDGQYDRFARSAGKLAVDELSRMQLDYDHPTARDIATVKRVLSMARSAARKQIMGEAASGFGDD